MQDYSVLMSVYHKENAEYLRTAIQSMFGQTVPTNDFVLVCDGSLTGELDGVISEMEAAHPDVMNVIRISEHKGLGNALNEGLKNCKNELVARMDSDDISLPRRCELQLERFMANEKLALCSGDIAEFDDDPQRPISIRHVPETHEEILKYAKKRSPMNHMAVMFRKSAVESVGGYIEVNGTEDYYLWARMLNVGYKAANIPQTLVNARVGNGMYERRGGISYIKSAISLQKKMLDMGFIRLPRFLMNCVIRTVSAALPEGLRRYLYQKILRVKANR